MDHPWKDLSFSPWQDPSELASSSWGKGNPKTNGRHQISFTSNQSEGLWHRGAQILTCFGLPALAEPAQQGRANLSCLDNCVWILSCSRLYLIHYHWWLLNGNLCKWPNGIFICIWNNFTLYFHSIRFDLYLIMPMRVGMNSNFPETVCSDTIGLLAHTNIASLPDMVLYHLACFWQY